MLRVVHFQGGEIVYDSPALLVLSLGLTAHFRLDYEVAKKRADVLPMVGRFGLMTPGERFRVLPVRSSWRVQRAAIILDLSKQSEPFGSSMRTTPLAFIGEPSS